MTRAKELESLSNWAYRNNRTENSEDLANAIQQHLAAARDAATKKGRFRLWKHSSLVQRANGNLAAAAAQLLNLAPPSYVLDKMSGLLNHVQRHLAADDPRRQDFERIAQTLGVKNENQTSTRAACEETIDEERGRIIAAVRGASAAALRQQQGLAGFRNILIATIIAMTLLAVGVAVTGFVDPTAIPLCFTTEQGGQILVVCPTSRSPLGPTGQQAGTAAPDVAKAVTRTTGRADLFIIELIGLIAAAVAAAAAIRGIRGSSETYGLPVALAVLKLPTGAITAFLGLLLISGDVLPGLTLDTSPQILAWAVIFGYAQQLFTRLVDQQARAVLDTVGGGDKGSKSRSATPSDQAT
ncbi:MAG: hypothetical protein ACRDS0_00625 [Pseudonocardiaceae bacterium]